MKKILSLILCFAMTMSSMTVPVMAFAEEVSDTPVQEAAAVSAVPISAKPDMTMPSVSFHDTANHLGTKAIDRWAGFGVIKGDERGNFNPDGDLNRAELATILTNLLGLTAKAANSYADVPANAWYADAVLKCTAAGIMKGDGINATPLANISRQESMVMIGRALGITPAATVDLAAFTDGSAVAPWAAPYVTTMLKAGIVNGVGENLVAPNANMSRAAVVTVLDKAISDYIKVAGTYDKLVGTGLVVVAAPGVVLKDGQVQNLLVAQGAADGSLTLENTNVIGNTMVLDNATVILKNSKLQTLEVL
ncbi:MAG: S-layer homology domain-containing protein, partial [Clostridiales bacterium]